MTHKEAGQRPWAPYAVLVIAALGVWALRPPPGEPAPHGFALLPVSAEPQPPGVVTLDLVVPEALRLALFRFEELPSDWSPGSASAREQAWRPVADLASLEELRELIGHREALVRLAAAQTLLATAPEAARAVLPLLDDRTRWVVTTPCSVEPADLQSQVLDALCTHAAQPAPGDVLLIVARKRWSRHRWRALECVATRRPGEVSALTASILAQGDYEERVSLAGVLGVIPGDDSRGTLERLLSSTTEQVTDVFAAAAEAYAGRSDGAATVTRQLLGDRRPTVRMRAALGHLRRGDPGGLRAFEQYVRRFPDDEDPIGQLRRRDLEAPAVREGLHALLDLPAGRAWDKLLEVLATAGDEAVRPALLRELGGLRHDMGRRFLRDLDRAQSRCRP